MGSTRWCEERGELNTVSNDQRVECFTDYTLPISNPRSTFYNILDTPTACSKHVNFTYPIC